MIGESTCFYAPDTEAVAGAQGAPRTLVIFLHSLVGDGSGWQWEQQRLMQRTAKLHGFSALMPRGRLAVGPGRDPKTWAWPTATALQEQLEDGLIAEWMSAKVEVERRTSPFNRVLVFGFSNGAYYATSLALRGRLDVDGYGVFAGGSGAKYLKLQAARAQHKAPIFVGYGTKDPDHHRQRALVRLLRQLGWKHRAKAASIGHTVSDAQIRSALQFLRGD
jgi:predicted esterase